MPKVTQLINDRACLTLSCFICKIWGKGPCRPSAKTRGVPRQRAGNDLANRPVLLGPSRPRGFRATWGMGAPPTRPCPSPWGWHSIKKLLPQDLHPPRRQQEPLGATGGATGDFRGPPCPCPHPCSELLAYSLNGSPSHQLLLLPAQPRLPAHRGPQCWGHRG